MIVRSRRLLAALCALVVAAAVLAGCSDDGSDTAQTPGATGVTIPGDFSGAGPGTLRSATTLPTVDRRVTRLTTIAARITYTSTSGTDGSEKLVSGTVFSPVGPAPAGGWPIVAFGHTSTGVQHECAPSLSPSLLGSVDAIGVLVNTGYVVVMPDYQGLGLDDTYHPYLDSTTEGNNMIDGVRAARKLVPDTSNRWVALGSSQGGQASWAANERSEAYGSGLDLAGSVSLAPAADIIGFADAAQAGTLTTDQMALYPWILYALKNEHPEMNLDDYRRGVVEERWDVLTACQGPAAGQRADVTKLITADDVRPSSRAATDTLRGYLREMSLPKTAAGAPMLVIYGGKDQLVNPAWTRGAVTGVCRLGARVESYLLADRGHDDIDATYAVTWIKNRLADAPVVNGCNRPPATLETSAPGTAFGDQG
ncbi:lipase family protein [Williamsia phyllosphaerae]|uniref:Lipase n=1 Tax=Williamsia phyllosphaerae TaxID=885042 RepID=A0ABQ1UWZ0_9NOCA|nr:lipase family protein [Williamsia phyllosphaerae]GGF28636.1 putative lipase [Williamsia phyllosphaerae]